MSIRGRLYLMGCIVLIVIASMGAVTYYRGDSILTTLVNDAGMEIVESAAQNIDARLERIEGVVMTAAEAIRDAIIRYGAVGDEDVEKLVMTLTARMQGDDILFLYMGHESTGRFSDGFGRKKPEDYDSRVRSWYKDAVSNSGKVVLTDPYADSITGNIVSTMAIAVNDNSGNLLGVVGLDINLEGITEYVKNLGIFGKGNGILLLPDGIVMAGHREEDILKANITTDEKFPESLRYVAKKMIAGGTGNELYSYSGIDNQMFYSSTKRGLSLGILFPVHELRALIKGLTFVLLIIAGAALAVVAAIVFVITRSLSRSIGAMGAATRRLGSGELTVKFDDSGKDEIAAISQDLNTMAASLREVMASIRKEADETARYADTLASLSEETLSSMEEVSASINRVEEEMESSSSALEEANASIEEIASGAQSAAQASADGADGAVHASEAANTSLTEVEAAIRNIKNASGESENAIEKIRALARSVDDISGFVSIITSIADQTNLLALNAAIEAARAGEAGRGFAVVAEEVRKLAEESARSANEVSKLIEELQKHSGESISATEKTGTILGETIEGAEITRQHLSTAVDSIGTVAGAVQNIAAVSQEQAASSEEMTAAIQSVTEATLRAVETMRSIETASGETTKAAEVIATEAQQMAAAADRLGKLIEQFIIDDASGGLLPVQR